MDSQIELSKIFFNSFIGFHYYTELHQKSFKEERKKEKKKTFIPKGASTNGTKEPMRGAARETFSRKNKSLKSPKYTNMSSIKREY